MYNPIYDTIETPLDAMKHNVNTIPTQLALVDGDLSYTWSHLDEITSRAAAGLIEMGVQRGECVGINTTAMGAGIIAIWSILKAGGAYTFLNPAFPAERLNYIRQDTQIKLEVTDRLLEDIMQHSLAELPIMSGTDRYAILYTSGSTGIPKKIIIPHRGTIFFARNYIKNTDLTYNDNVFMFAGLSFAMHNMDFFPHAITGATLHVLPVEIKSNLTKLVKYYNDNNITASIVPTAIGKKILETEGVSTLRTITLAGEKLTPFNSVNRHIKVFNAYGCTETFGTFTMGEVDLSNLNVGKEIDGVTVDFVDADRNSVPPGDEGEIAATMYGHTHYTGDLGRRLPDGNIDVRGRVDFQLSIRGYRIDPSEIELRLLKYPGIIEAVAVNFSDRLVAYYSAAGCIDSAVLKNYLSEHLPPYMVPSTIAFLNKLPRNINGKIDRRTLPEPFVSRSGGKPIEGETAKRLSAIWKEVLDLPKIELYSDDSFADLGGDSLCLMMLSVQIESVFNATITPAMLQEVDLLEGQAELIDNTKPFTPLFAFNPKGGNTPLFFTHSANTGPEVFARLAELLSDEQPFYACEHYNLLKSERLGIKALAQKYVDEMLKTRPSAKYKLGGWSLGGSIAFEMALILEKRGIEIQELYLIDPQIFGEEERRLNAELGALPYYINYLKTAPIFKAHQNNEQIDKLISNNEFSLKEASNYIPSGVLKAPATLFKMTEQDADDYASDRERAILSQLWALKTADNGFAPYAENLRIIKIADTHDRFIENDASLKTIAHEIMQ